MSAGACARREVARLAPHRLRPARDRSRVPSGLRAHALPFLLGLAGCSATDVVARWQANEDCARSTSGCPAPPGLCAPTGCSPLASRSLLCQDGQQQVEAGDSCDGQTGARVSRFALCACTDLVTSAPLSMDAFSGTPGQSSAGLAALGVNRDLALGATGAVDGPISVGGRSSVSAEFVLTSPIAKAKPCDCSAEAMLDIGGLVQARAGDNDNTQASVRSEQLDNFRGPQELLLTCGRYFFTRFKGSEPVSIRTRGNVAIFVEKNIELDGSLRIQTEDEGHVSLFVAGDMRVGGALSIGGDPNGQSRADLYLASTGTLEIAGSLQLSGRLYAPRAELVTRGPVELYGSMFVRRAAPGGEMQLHYDVLSARSGSCARLP